VTKKSPVLFRLLIGALALGLGACSDGNSPTRPTAPTLPPSTTYRLSGTVTDATTGSALAGAEVRILGGPYETTVTNAAGGYVFENLAKATGRINIEAAKDGYQAKGDQVPGTGDAIRNFPLGASDSQ
jgi:hypothetical protein